MTGFRIAGAPAPYLHHEATAARAPHGFFGAAGGVSTGLHASLNCGYGSQDDPALVAQNRGRAAAAMELPADRLAAVYQVHGTDVVMAVEGAAEDRSQLVRADGLVTTQRGLGLTILTADCLPLLLVDDGGDVIGACHAGWRGVAARILPEAILRLEQRGAQRRDLLVALGPAVSGARYQVGQEVVDAVGLALSAEPGDPSSDQEVLQRDGALQQDAEAGRHRLDIRRAARLQLLNEGITTERIALCPLCTVGEPELFHSWRRDQVKAVQWSGIVAQAASGDASPNS